MIIDGQYIYGKNFDGPLHANKEYLIDFLEKFKNSKVYFLGISEHSMCQRNAKPKRLPKNWKGAQDGTEIIII